jgi:hypothetical protein
MSTSIATKVVPTAMTDMNTPMRPGLTATSTPTPTGIISTTTSAVTDEKPRVR